MPRGRPDPFSQVADGGRVHLVAALEILEQERPQLDEPKGRLAPRDDGVHARAVAVVGTHTTVAVTVKRRCIAAVPAVPLTGDQIDEGGIFGLLHGSLTLRRMGKSAVVWGPPFLPWGARSDPDRQELGPV